MIIVGGSKPVKYVAVTRVSDATETVTTSGSLNLNVPRSLDGSYDPFQI